MKTRCDWLTGVGDGEAVGRLDVVHVRHQVERGFRGVRAGVVQEDRQTKGRVLLISVSDEQTAWEREGGQVWWDTLSLPHV